MLIYQGSPVREKCDIADDKVYLRAANICPCANSVAAAIDDFVALWRREGDACWGLAENAPDRKAKGSPDLVERDFTAQGRDKLWGEEI